MKKRVFASVLCCLMVLLCACEKKDGSSAGPDISPKAIEGYKEMVEAMRNAVPKENVLREDPSGTVFGSGYKREDITAVCFGKTLKKIPASSWDVSRDGNGTVKAWIESYGDNRILHIAGEGGVRAPESCREMFAGYSNVTSFDFGDRFDTSAVVDMYGMFRDCRRLEGVLNLTIFQTASVTEMGEMFAGMLSVETIDLSSFDTSNVTGMRGMFRDYCGESLDLSGFNTANVTDMGYMFDGSALKALDLQNFDTAAVTDMTGMFSGCTQLESLNIRSFRTANVQSMAYLFDRCGLRKIDVNHFNTAEVKDMTSMFAGCEGITSLDLTGLETGRVEKMSNMFCGCTGLVTVDVSSFDTANVTDMSGMFYNCNMLETPNFSGFDVTNVEEFDQFMLPGKEVDGKPWEAMFSSSHHLIFM